MATKVQVVSKALVLLGQPPVASLNDGTRNTKAADAIFDLTRQTFLSKSLWKFALREVMLAQLPNDGTEKRLGYGFMFQLPVDMLRAGGDPTDYTPYQIAGDRLYANVPEFPLLYVADVPIEQFPAYAADAFAYVMAKELALTVTEDDSRKERIVREASDAVMQALGIDSTVQTSWDLALERIFFPRPTDRF